MAHLESHGCVICREGAKHTVYRNPINGHISTVPRHEEIFGHLDEKSARIWAYPNSGRNEASSSKIDFDCGIYMHKSIFG